MSVFNLKVIRCCIYSKAKVPKNHTNFAKILGLKTISIIYWDDINDYLSLTLKILIKILSILDPDEYEQLDFSSDMLQR